MNTSIIDSYMIFLQTLNPDERLSIISKLTQTLKSEIKPKENLFAKSFGAWSGSESADEIVKGIKDSRTFTGVGWQKGRCFVGGSANMVMDKKLIRRMEDIEALPAEDKDKVYYFIDMATT